MQLCAMSLRNAEMDNEAFKIETPLGMKRLGFSSEKFIKPTKKELNNKGI